jgi:hypothetical protein
MAPYMIQLPHSQLYEFPEKSCSVSNEMPGAIEKKKKKKKELIKSPLAINIIILEKVGSQGFQPVSSSWTSLFWK